MALQEFSGVIYIVNDLLLMGKFNLLANKIDSGIVVNLFDKFCISLFGITQSYTKAVKTMVLAIDLSDFLCFAQQ